MEYSEVEALVAYLQLHPLVAVAGVVLAVMVLGSLIRKLIKAAIILALIFLAGLYWTHNEADADWRARADGLARRATALGHEAMDRGKALLEESIKEGREELKKRIDEQE